MNIASLQASPAASPLPPNPPPPSGCRPLRDNEVTPAISALAVDILHGPLELFQAALATLPLGGKDAPIVAWVNVHPPDFQNHIRHRGVTIYEQIGEVTGTTIVPMPTEGIDASHFQGQIDWKLVASRPSLYWRQKKFAMIKATEGEGYVDPKFIDNWMASAGVLPRSAYHFLHTGVDIQAQLQHFVDQVGGDVGELCPMVDVEPYLMNGRYVTPTRDEVLLFLNALQSAAKRQPILYIGDVLAKSMNLLDEDLAIAHYGVRKPDIAGYSFHQYSQTGTCPGITTHVDLDRFNGGDDDFAQYLTASAPGLDEPV